MSSVTSFLYGLLYSAIHTLEGLTLQGNTKLHKRKVMMVQSASLFSNKSPPIHLY